MTKYLQTQLNLNRNPPNIPLWHNLAFSVEGQPLENEEWEIKGISLLIHLFTDVVVVSFEQLKNTFNLTNEDFWL